MIPPIIQIKLSLGLELLFFVLLLFFALQAAFLSYHWINYGSDRKMSITALCIYLAGGSVLLLTYSFALKSI